MIRSVLLTVFVFLTYFTEAQYMFPGAEGFGSDSRGAYAGDSLPIIVKVTNLNDAGPGSLRAAIYKKVPRIIVFEVSGVIELKKTLRIYSPYLFLAGQTAPYPGITLKNNSLGISTHDVLIQGLKIRPGTASGEQIDGINIADDSTKLYNIVVDHCSISWATDENIGILNGGKGITISNCIISEALTYKNHSCGLLAMNTGQISIIKNLFVHNADRNPLVRGDSQEALIANNIVYNSDTHALYFGSQGPIGLPLNAAALNNFYVPGIQNRNEYIISISSDIHVGSRLFLKGNKTHNLPNGDQWGMRQIHNPGNRAIATFDKPIEMPPLAIIAVSQLQNHLFENCGAHPENRDVIDQRIISDVRNQSGRRIRSPINVGGWPGETGEQKITLMNDPHGDVDGNGFTNIEEWLNQLLLKSDKLSSVIE